MQARKKIVIELPENRVLLLVVEAVVGFVDVVGEQQRIPRPGRAIERIDIAIFHRYAEDLRERGTDARNLLEVDVVDPRILIIESRDPLECAAGAGGRREPEFL